MSLQETYCPDCAMPLADIDIALSKVLKGLCVECAKQAQWEAMTPDQRRNYDQRRGR